MADELQLTCLPQHRPLPATPRIFMLSPKPDKELRTSVVSDLVEQYRRRNDLDTSREPSRDCQEIFPYLANMPCASPGSRRSATLTLGTLHNKMLGGAYDMRLHSSMAENEKKMAQFRK